MMDITAILHMHAELSLTAVFILMFLLDLFLPAPQRHWLRPMACILLTIQLLANLWPEEVTLFGGMYHSTPMASVLKSILTIGTILVFLQADTWLKREDTRHKQGEFYILTLSTLLGMYFMVSAGHFLLFFLGLELATVPMACLVAFDKYKGHSAEAGAKFILSALFSSGIFLYGISMIYGTAGTLYFEDIPAGLTGTPLQVLALVFFFSGLAFKLSLVPFHLWTADTYQGAPTTVSAYLSVISKGAAAFALMIILMKVFGPMTEQWSEILCIIIVATITIANLFAIRQNNLKRFMAFSSISQAGYIMLAVLAGTPQGMASLVYYIVVYIAANLAVFGVINTIEQHTHGKIEREDYNGLYKTNPKLTVVYIAANLAVFGVINTIEQHTHGKIEREDYNGLYKTNPKLTMVMTLALFSLAGIPPFAGFFSKFFVFMAAFHSGYYLIVFIALVNTIISLYYYLLIVKAMFITPNEDPIGNFRTATPMRISLLVCVAGIFVLGIISGVYQLLSDTAIL
ncbi:NADH-quinone oxidoreductase subunit N [Phocaeicola vulgatus]|uniref:NADH-quinone oxidoreductase subunit N n=1 Tax=Phocaeicola vulgatus TaxID=821 RepID=A0A3E4WZD8_PHOVU|nr:NADH-quinone oxidoreductase subunit N [Phocaeicola vulgatus]